MPFGARFRQPYRRSICQPERRVSARLSGDLSVLLAALSSSGYGQWTVSRAVYLYIAALEVNVLNCRDESVWSLSLPVVRWADHTDFLWVLAG